MYYQRLTTNVADPFALFLEKWVSEENTLNTDFKLYGSKDDLHKGENAW